MHSFCEVFNKIKRIYMYVYEALMRCKIQSFEEWLVEANDASTPFTQFKESELLSETQIMKQSLHALKNWRKKFFSSMNVSRMKFKVSLVLLHHTGTPIYSWCKHCLTTSGHVEQVTGTCIYVPQKKCCHGSMPRTILIMLDILHITSAFSRILELNILGRVKLTLINILVQKGRLGASFVCPQNKLFNKQLTTTRKVKVVLSVAIHQRAQDNNGF